MVTIDREKRASRLYEHWEMQREVAERWLERTGASEVAPLRSRAGDGRARWRAPRSRATPRPGPSEPVKVSDRVLAGFGWQRDDVKLVQQMASNGAEPIGSLGYDGPLAALSPERQNLADYFKETVAVVTNPAIDREREIEHFSTRAVFGRRPSLHAPAADAGTIETSFPVILGGHHDLAPAVRLDLPQDRPRAQDLPARGPLGGVPRPRRRDRHRAARVRDHAGGDRAHQAGGRAAGARGRRAARAHRPHRLRRRAPLPRPAPGHLRRRPGAEAAPSARPARRTCGAAARSCCARRRSATSTTWSSRWAWAPTASART